MTGILIDTDTEDLMLKDDTMVTGDTEHQTVELLLLTASGEWKEHPWVGADAMRQLGGNADKMWCGKTKKMIRACGVDVNSVSISDDGLVTIE